jgi:hypothetical protein
MDWIHLAWWQALVNAMMNLWVPQNAVSRLAENLLASEEGLNSMEFIRSVTGVYMTLSGSSVQIMNRSFRYYILRNPYKLTVTVNFTSCKMKLPPFSTLNLMLA